MAETKTSIGKKLRQEQLRDYLSANNKIRYIFDNLTKLEDLKIELNNAETARLRTATDIRLKLLNKYLPDLKSTEITTDNEDGGFTINVMSYAKQDIKKSNDE